MCARIDAVPAGVCACVVVGSSHTALWIGSFWERVQWRWTKGVERGEEGEVLGFFRVLKESIMT